MGNIKTNTSSQGTIEELNALLDMQKLEKLYITDAADVGINISPGIRVGSFPVKFYDLGLMSRTDWVDVLVKLLTNRVFNHIVCKALKTFTFRIIPYTLDTNQYFGVFSNPGIDRSYSTALQATNQDDILGKTYTCNKDAYYAMMFYNNVGSYPEGASDYLGIQILSVED